MDQNLNQNDVESLQEELHTKIYPGTEIMADVGAHHFQHGTRGSRSVLVPQPSDDKHDPLNWSPLWKSLTLFCSTLVTFTQGFAPLAIAPMFPILEKEFGVGLAEVVQFIGITILVLGFSNFFWVPFMTTFGRRPTLILSSVICLASSIWRAEARGYSMFFGACILNGIGGGPAETAQPAIIADVFFLHDRGKYNTLYFATYFGSTSVGPIVAGVMAEAVGWRSFWWLCSAMNLFTLICCVGLFPETMYHRPLPTGSTAHHTGLLESRASRDRPHDPIINYGKNNGSIRTTTISEKPNTPDSSKDGEEQPGTRFTESKHDGPDDSQAMQESNPPPTSLPPPHDIFLGTGKPSRQQWFPFQLPARTHFIKTISTQFFLPWELHLFPIVEFAAFVVSFSASCQLLTNLTQSQVFAAPPYSFNPLTIGFFNFAILAGECIGLATAGPLSDWVADVLTRRNGGVREAEMRLLSMVPFVAVMILGNFVIAFGYQYQWDWRVIVILGYGSAGVQVAALPSIASTYAIDSYKPVAGSIFVAITVNKNLYAYGLSRFITPWIEKSGYAEPIMVHMCLTILWCAFGLLFWYKGKVMRGWTRGSKVHTM